MFSLLFGSVFRLLDLVLVVAICLLPFSFLFSWNQPRAMMRSAQFDEWVPSFDGDAERFYTLLYQRLQRDVVGSALPFSTVRFGSRKLFARRSIFSSRVTYLTVRYQHLSYIVYAVPTLGGLHVSAWLFSKHDSWMDRPFLKYLVAWKRLQMTLFQFDIMRLFDSVVQSALAEVLDELREGQGLPPLESFERRPVLNGFYASMQQGIPTNGMSPHGMPMVAPLRAGTSQSGKRVNAIQTEPVILEVPLESNSVKAGDSRQG